MRNKQLFAPFLFFLCFLSCDDSSFVESVQNVQQPSKLVYMDVVSARESKSIATNAPTINTGGLVPVFELVDIKKSDGTILDESYLKHVTIGQTKTLLKDILGINGNVIKTLSSYDTSVNGVIYIAEGNNFVYGDYFFSMKVTTESDGIKYSTIFDKAFHLKVGPLLPTVLIYSPKNQNLVVGNSASKTTKPIIPNSNPEIKFELENNLDKLAIDASTGIISIASTYKYVQNETITPIIKVISKISGEVSTFKNAVSVVISDVPVAVPVESILFFYPTLKTSGSFPTGGDGYIVQTDIPGNGEDIWGFIDNSVANALIRPADRPATNTAQTVLETQTFTVSSTTPTSSWMVTTTQDLTPFQFGFKLSFNYYYMPAYQIYMADGRTPTDLEVYISTDYAGGDIQDAAGEWISGTWTKVNSAIKCSRAEGIDSSGRSIGAPWGTEFIGTPYPGDQKGADPDGRKNSSTTFYNKWVKCSYDIPVSQISKKYTVAFRVNSYFQGTLLNNATVPGRGGSFFLSDFNFKASE